MLSCTIGIMAYNEEANIKNILERLSSQETKEIKINKIFVVASGCTDKTVEITQNFAKENPIVNLLIQEKREGKASAVNFFLEKIRDEHEEIIVLVSADTLPEVDAIEKLILPFKDKEIGMTGAHPVPINKTDTFMGYLVNLVWELHHRIALAHPKMGEGIAFRNIFRRIPFESVVDEANIEPLVAGQGYHLKYIPDALIKNKGPTNTKDYIKQRRRIYSGHLTIRKFQGYSTSTMNPALIFFTLLKIMRWSPKYIAWTMGAIFLEAYGRLLGKMDFHAKKKSHISWDIAESTKDLGQC